MTVYLASPASQMQADYAYQMPVLISYALWSDWMQYYHHSWGPMLIDSGAFSVWNSGRELDIHQYVDWCAPWIAAQRPDAIAGLDDMRGDTKKAMANYEAFPFGFPTFHDTDPPEFLDELIALARERKPPSGWPSRRAWLGISLVPPYDKHGMDWVRRTCDRIPEDLHVHAWGMRKYWKANPRIDSVDSTNWIRDAMAYRKQMPFLTSAQALQVVIWRYQHERRHVQTSPPKGFFD